MAIAVVLVLLVIGTVAFHVLNPWWFTPIASNWGTMDDTVNLTFWVTGAVFVGVNLFMAYAIVRYRHRKGVERRAEYEPEYRKLEWWLIGLTSVGVIAMLAPGLAVWAKFVTVPDDADVVEAVGQQWSWSFRLPGADGVLGAVDASLMSAGNPFGMDPNDPRGRDDVLVPGAELHLPLDRPVKVLLRSKDVLHDFTVPEFRVKMDLVPGMVTFMWLTPTKAGQYEILCEELCGTGHFAMRGRVVVDDAGRPTHRGSPGQQTFAQIQARPAGDAVAGATAYAVCARVPRRERRGQPGAERAETRRTAGLVPLASAAQLQAGRARRRARRRHRQPDGGDRPAARRGDVRQRRRVRRDAARRARRRRRCAAMPRPAPRVTRPARYCHGARGQGSWSTNAPPLAGRSDWYLARQLQQFRQGHRGRHPQDFHGSQMARLSNVVPDGEPTADLLAYINTLR